MSGTCMQQLVMREPIRIARQVARRPTLPHDGTHCAHAAHCMLLARMLRRPAASWAIALRSKPLSQLPGPPLSGGTAHNTSTATAWHRYAGSQCRSAATDGATAWHSLPFATPHDPYGSMHASQTHGAEGNNSTVICMTVTKQRPSLSGALARAVGPPRGRPASRSSSSSSSSFCQRQLEVPKLLLPPGPTTRRQAAAHTLCELPCLSQHGWTAYAHTKTRVALFFATHLAVAAAAVSTRGPPGVVLIIIDYDSSLCPAPLSPGACVLPGIIIIITTTTTTTASIIRP